MVSKLMEAMWFPPMPAARLAFLRIATGLFALWYVGVRYSMYLKIADGDRLLFAPVGVVSWLSNPLPVGWFETLLVLTLLANAAFILGWRYRWTGPLFGLLLLVVLCYRNSWSMIYHNDNALVVHVLILGLVRAADVWSLDAVRSQGPPLGHTVHWRYGWPVQLMCAATAATYFLAGVAKLAGELGWSWATGESLRGQIAADVIRKQLLGESTSPLAFALYDQVWLFSIIGCLSLAVELGAPLAVASRRAGMFWAVNAFAMHWGIFFIMSITFRYQLSGLIFLSFFPVEKLINLFHRSERLPEPELHAGERVVVYDGRCRFCLAQMRMLRTLDWFGSLRFLSLHDRRASALLPDLSFEQLMQAMVVIGQDGRRYFGAGAVRYLSRCLPSLWLLAPILHIPGSFGVWTALYGAIARTRYKIAGLRCEEDGACRLKG